MINRDDPFYSLHIFDPILLIISSVSVPGILILFELQKLENWKAA